MSFKYNLTVTEILQKMGYTKTKDNILNEQQKGIVLPAVLNDFLSLAINTSLFSTSDVWVQTRRFICFLYDLWYLCLYAKECSAIHRQLFTGIDCIRVNECQI